MGVYKRGQVYWIDFSFNNKRYRKPSPDSSYKGAKAFELLIRQKLARGEPLKEPEPDTKYFFKEIALQWLNIEVKNNNKPSEFVNRRNILNDTLIPYFGNKYIDAIATQNIEEYKGHLLESRTLAPKSVNNYLAILSRCLNSALEAEILKSVPKIKLLKVPPQKFDHLTELETEQLLQCANGVLHDMILLAVRTGLRFGELIALQWEDINLKERTFVVSRNRVRGIEGSPKNNKSRIIPLAVSVVEILNTSKRKCLYVFHDSKGDPLTYSASRKRLHKICKSAGLRTISWHVLRHTFASHLASKGVSIFSIKELLGHSDIRMTMRYSHVNLPILKSAIEVLEPTNKINDTIMPQLPRRGSESGFPLSLKLQNYLEEIKKQEVNPVN